MRRLAGVIAILVGTVMLFGIIFDLGARIIYFGLSSNSPQQNARTEQSSDSLHVENTQGSQIFTQHCEGCHGENGGGGFGPALAGNGALRDSAHVSSRIVNGGGGMPAFSNQLSDEEVSVVASFVRNSWGNAFGPVSAEEVGSQR